MSVKHIFTNLSISATVLIFLIFALFPLSPNMGYGETGALKYYQNYPVPEGLQPQNWSILQDQRGIIYAANQGGLLEFDGVSWREIVIPNHTVRSLAMDENGIIYVGGNNEFGFIGPDSKGSLQYISLLNYLDEKKKNFGMVYRTHSTQEGIYFWTINHLYRWTPGAKKIRVWKQGSKRFSVTFECNGRLFVLRKNIGLMEMVDDSLKLLPGTGIFAPSRIVIITPYNDKKLLIGTRSRGLYLYDGTEVVSFPTDVDDYLKTSRMMYGIRLSASLSPAPTREFAIPTLDGGLVIIDSRGHLKHIFDKTSGIQDNSIKHVFEDSTGNLWLALNNGISKIEYASPLSWYDEKHSGLAGLVLSVVRHLPDNEVFAGGTNGLYRLTSEGAFRVVPGVRGACWSLLSGGGRLLAAMADGVYQVKKTGVEQITEICAYTLLRSRRDTNRIWVGTKEGLTALYFRDNQWREEYRFGTVTTQVRSVLEDGNGNLWLGTLNQGVIKVNFTGNGNIKHPVVTGYGVEQGLPPGEIFVFEAPDHFMFCTDKGVFRFDEKTKTFIPDTALGVEFTGGPDGRGIFRMAKDKNNNIWFHSKRRNFHAALQPDGAFLVSNAPFLRVPKDQTNAIYTDPDGGTAWFANHGNLIRFDTQFKKNHPSGFSTLIRKVWLNGSLFFDGYKKKARHKENPLPTIPYRDRNFRFEYAAPFFEDETRTEYGYLLEGYDEDWSGWTRETRKDYTNLDAGTYTFRVRAKNVYEHIGREDRFSFKVLPPWTQTWWAYIIYTFGAALLFYLAFKWRHQQLVKEKRQLEQVVKNRTREIQDKNLQLEQQSEQLKELDEAKSRFFANISHEFRTPLTLIMGPLEKRLSMAREKREEKRDIQELQMMLRNSQRLLNLINQLLELARLDSGKMKLEASEQNIIPFLKRVVMCFESLAEQNSVDLIFISKGDGGDGDDEIPVYFDEEKLEKIITNLLSNAFKYTPAQGTITVTARRAGGVGNFPSGCVEVSVRDTGVGIPEDQLPHIFNRFHRAEGGHEHKQKGSGIGLALTKELVELHNGEIEVQSRCGGGPTGGSEFLLRLPLGETPAGRRPLLPQPGEEPVSETSSQTVTESPGMEPDDEKPLILVVDDNADVRTYIKGSLEPSFNVVEAGGGREGVLRAKEIIPDLIVSDVMMPEIDGFELSRTLKHDVLTCHIPIILLTARVSEDSVLEGLETGADDYITKPFSSRLLAVRIGNLIELRRTLQLQKKNRMSLLPEGIPVSPLDDEFYQTLQDSLETHLSDPDFNVEALSRALQMSPTTLGRKIHAFTGKTPTAFIRSFRIKRAAQLLSAQAGTVSETADKVGFTDKSYFTKCFKAQFHRLPSELQSAGAAAETAETDGAASPTGPVDSDGDAKPGKEIVLVVEDNDDARRYIRDSLEPDYRVLEASDGAEGLTRAVKIVPDLVVSDIMMPRMDGYELCGELKKDVRTSHIPLVLLTAKASEEHIIRGLETGADDYITKPFNTDILRVRIKNLIRLRSHLHKERYRDMALLPAKIKESGIHREFEKELNAAIEKNMEDPEFNVERLAKKLYMSSATVYRKIQAVSGEVPSEYIRSFRLKRAAELLKLNAGSVTEVAFQVGFNSRAYFTKCFKEKFHQLPSVYMTAQSQ